MKRMTKREALQSCIDGWIWQAKHPESTNKRDNPVFKGCLCTCPCCEYDGTHMGVYCAKTCLIAWPNSTCTSGESPFTLWGAYRMTDKDRTKYALQIVALARKALRKLNVKTGKPAKRKK